MIEFIIGLFVGCMIGIGVMCLLSVSGHAEERAEEMRRKAGLE
jgi:hypothetical protein